MTEGQLLTTLISGGAGSGLIAKIVWDWLKNRNGNGKVSCPFESNGNFRSQLGKLDGIKDELVKLNAKQEISNERLNDVKTSIHENNQLIGKVLEGQRKTGGGINYAG